MPSQQVQLVRKAVPFDFCGDSQGPRQAVLYEVDSQAPMLPRVAGVPWDGYASPKRKRRSLSRSQTERAHCDCKGTPPWLWQVRATQCQPEEERLKMEDPAKPKSLNPRKRFVKVLHDRLGG